MTASKTVRTSTAIADPDNPSHVLKPAADGSLTLSGNLTVDPTNLNIEATQLLVKTAVQSLASKLAASTYETVTAGITAQVLGGAGAVGDFLARLVIVPATVGCGSVVVLDGATAITVFTGGAVTALADARPQVVEIGALSASGAWKVTTGANVSVIGVGNFT